MTIADPADARHKVEFHGKRIGYRVSEWSRMTGTSRQTTWRAIRNGTLKTVSYAGITLIPDSERGRLGFDEA